MKTLIPKLAAYSAAAMIGCGLLVSQANAVQITGAINFTGSGSATQSGSGATQVTTINFNNDFHVIGATGSYAGVPTNNSISASFTNFQFTGNGLFNNATLSGPSAGGVPNEWSFTYLGRTYSFDLATLDPANSMANSASISLQGTGTLRITNGNGSSLFPGTVFDPTFGSFALSGAGAGLTFTFINASSSALPEGGSALALLGVALVGVEIFRRRLLSV